MISSAFDFFELIVDEFQGRAEVFFGIGHMQDRHGNPDALFLELKKELKVSTDAEVIPCAVRAINAHFVEKAGVKPFKYEGATSRFYAPNEDYFAFIRTCKEIRSLGPRARDFELAILDRLSTRLSGDIHRVGFPRETLKKRDEFNAYLKENFGFKHDVALGQEKDAGFDILWKMPLGTEPFVPIVSIQCKNGKYSYEQAASSVMSSKTSLAQHVYLRNEAHVNCVVFNDYLDAKELFPKGVEFVPMGLCDLLRNRKPPSKSYAI